MKDSIFKKLFQEVVDKYLQTATKNSLPAYDNLGLSSAFLNKIRPYTGSLIFIEDNYKLSIILGNVNKSCFNGKFVFKACNLNEMARFINQLNILLHIVHYQMLP